jgi:hypothetical protein
MLDTTDQHLFATKLQYFFTTVNMKYATVLLVAAATVSAHSTWQELWVGSEDKAGTCVRTVKDNSPVTSLTSSDMFCGRGPAASSGVCEVAGTFPSRPLKQNP